MNTYNIQWNPAFRTPLRCDIYDNADQCCSQTPPSTRVVLFEQFLGLSDVEDQLT